MTRWKQIRRWDAAKTEAVAGGFAVELDGRPVLTPAKRKLVLPTRALADLVAGEWDCVEGQVTPEEMPITRLANAAVDKVSDARSDVVDLIAEYGNTDLLCYRAADPVELVEAQSRAWDPVLEWVRERFGADLRIVRGVMPVDQPAECASALRRAVDAAGLFGLSALFEQVTLTGSLALGLAARHGRWAPRDIWWLSRVDERWQQDRWGADSEEAASAETRLAAFLSACEFAAAAGAEN